MGYVNKTIDDQLAILKFHELHQKEYPETKISPCKPFSDKDYRISQNNAYRFGKNFLKRNNICSFEICCSAGKTKLGARFAKDYIKKGIKVLVISWSGTVTGDETQGNIREYREVLGSECMLGDSLDITNDVSFITYRKFFLQVFECKEPEAIQKFFSDIGLIIVDEAHHSPQDKNGETLMIGKIEELVQEISQYHDTKVITMTANHERPDGKLPFGRKPDFKWTLIENIRAGYSPNLYGIQVINNAKDIKTKANRDGDYIYVADYNSVANITMKIYKNDSSPQFFVLSRVKHCKALQRILNLTFIKEYDEAFAIMDSHTKPKKRKEIIEKIKSGEMLGFITVQVASEGIDIPQLKYCHLLIKTKSWIRLNQCVGRVVRQHVDKNNMCVVIDYKVMKKEVLQNALGFWNIVNKSGSKLTKDQIPCDGLLLDASDDPEERYPEIRKEFYSLGDWELYANELTATEVEKFCSMEEYVKYVDSHINKSKKCA